MVLHADIDLLAPPAALEMQKHKLKRLVQVRSVFVLISTLTIVSSRLGQQADEQC